MINAKLSPGLFLVVLLTSGANCDDHSPPPGCASNYTCPPYVIYDYWDYRLAYCSKYTPCLTGPIPNCVYESGWQYWCFESEDGKLKPVPVYTHLDDGFQEIRTKSPSTTQQTNYTSTYAGITNQFNDNNFQGVATGMTLWTKSISGTMQACSAISTTYDLTVRNDTTHGATKNNFPSSFKGTSNTASIYRVTGFKDDKSIYIVGLKVDYRIDPKKTGSISCGNTDATGVNLNPVRHGACMLKNLNGNVDSVDGGLIRELTFTWLCDY